MTPVLAHRPVRRLDGLCRLAQEAAAALRRRPALRLPPPDTPHLRRDLGLPPEVTTPERPRYGGL